MGLATGSELSYRLESNQCNWP